MCRLAWQCQAIIDPLQIGRVLRSMDGYAQPSLARRVPDSVPRSPSCAPRSIQPFVLARKNGRVFA